jgi:thioredoxin-like negative regulator of GroEL
LPEKDARKPKLIFFHSPQSGHCRRVDGFLAQVLQRRRNHDTFELYRIDAAQRPDLLDRFGVDSVPTLIVLHNDGVQGRLEQPRDCRSIQALLDPWLTTRTKVVVGQSSQSA